MRLLRYTVPPEWDGAPLKEFAKKRLGFSTGVLAQQKRVPGGITQNGLPVFTTAVLRAGDEVAFALPEEPCVYPAAPLPLSVLWESEDFLLVDKPAGMPVHPSPGHDQDSLLHAVSYYYSRTGQSHRICPLYRLDKDTSGLMALGKHRLAASACTADKVYFAVCQGILSGEGTIDVPIGLEPGSKIKRLCGAGQRAVTHWQALCSAGGHTLCAIRLKTGRTHQIRAHFAHIGHPLAGDDLYGGSLAIMGRQALHCGWLSLSSPALAVPFQPGAGCPGKSGLRFSRRHAHSVPSVPLDLHREVRCAAWVPWASQAARAHLRDRKKVSAFPNLLPRFFRAKSFAHIAAWRLETGVQRNKFLWWGAGVKPLRKAGCRGGTPARG